MDMHLPVIQPRRGPVAITQSLLGSALDCEARYGFRYLYGLRLRQTSMPLITGTGVHNGFDLLLKTPGDQHEKLSAALTGIDEYYQQMQDNAFGSSLSSEKLLTSWAQAHALVTTWWSVWGEEASRWRVAGAEVTFQPDETVTHESHWLDRMAGKIDGLIADDEGIIRILEHKTRADLRGFDAGHLSIDLQLLWYHVLANYNRNVGWSIAVDTPIHALWNGMMKPRHRLKKNKPDLHELQQRMVGAILEEPSKYFILQKLDFSVEDYNVAERRFAALVARVDSLEIGNLTMNTARCGDFGGCAYRHLCRAGVNVNDPASVQKADALYMYEEAPVHIELEIPSDDQDIDIE